VERNRGHARVRSVPCRAAFRAEIQALRAIAVAGVVLFHLWPGAVPGGFVGVDVFFVISGFLITQQLVYEAATAGRVSLASFWGRRIRRILPAAFTVLLFSLVIVVTVMPTVAWQNNLLDIRAAAAYVANWQLGARSVDYLGGEASPSLVQHYWSLSVEEQFYVVWPLLVIATVMLAARVRGALLRGWLIGMVALTAVASFVVSVLWTQADAPVAFFATPTRAWEFAVGGLSALLLPTAFARMSGTVRGLLSCCGLGVVCFSMFVINGHDPFPGAIALVPVTGAAAVVAADLREPVRWSPLTLCRFRSLSWLGDNSYSIYLWHWPLLVAAPWMTHHSLGFADKLVIIAATLALAAATKRLVEDPIRTGLRWQSRLSFSYAFALVGVVAIAVAATDVSGGSQRLAKARASVERAHVNLSVSKLVAAPRAHSCFGAAAMDPANRCIHPFARTAGVDTAFAASDGPAEGCLQRDGAAVPVLCVVGQPTAPARTIALVGNSHAWRLVPALALYGRQHHWKIVVAARVNCLGLTSSSTGPGGASPNCLRWSAAVQSRLLSMTRLDAVIFASYRYTDEFTDGAHPTASQRQATSRQVLDLWAKFAHRHIAVLVTEDVPGMRPTADPECIARSTSRDDPCALSRSAVVVPNLLTNLARGNPRLAHYLPLDQYFCDAAHCHALIGGVVVYFDSHHLTTTFSRSLARYLGDEVAHALG
jgi:peptidoglycan/LPS O-acetylase OafA/YrhL